MLEYMYRKLTEFSNDVSPVSICYLNVLGMNFTFRWQLQLTLEGYCRIYFYDLELTNFVIFYNYAQ